MTPNMQMHLNFQYIAFQNEYVLERVLVCSTAEIVVMTTCQKGEQNISCFRTVMRKDRSEIVLSPGE